MVGLAKFAPGLKFNQPVQLVFQNLLPLGFLLWKNQAQFD